jgi:3-oxoacyl-[acyl-carrier-protein] synthase I
MSRGSPPIVALSARTPVGLTAESSAAAIRARISGIREHPFMVDLRGDPIYAAADARLDPRLGAFQRMFELASSALVELLEKLGACARAPMTLFLGLPEPRFNWTERDAAALATGLTSALLHGDVQVHAIPSGHASVLDALARARAVLEKDPDRSVVVGGVDTYLEADTLAWVDGHRRLAGRRGSRSGFAPGEASAFCALVSERMSDELGLAPLAVVEGAATGAERNLNGTSAVGLGRGLTDAIRAATMDLPATAQVHDVYCDINGERYRTDEWGFAILRGQARFARGGTYVTPVGEVGDVGAASGGLLTLLAAEAHHSGLAAGDRTLVWASSEMGLRGAAVIGSPRLD